MRGSESLLLLASLEFQVTSLWRRKIETLFRGAAKPCCHVQWVALWWTIPKSPVIYRHLRTWNWEVAQLESPSGFTVQNLVRGCNPNTWEVKDQKLKAVLCCIIILEAILGYMGPYLKQARGYRSSYALQPGRRCSREIKVSPVTEKIACRHCSTPARALREKEATN